MYLDIRIHYRLITHILLHNKIRAYLHINKEHFYVFQVTLDIFQTSLQISHFIDHNAYDSYA